MKKSSRNMNPYTLFEAKFFEKIKIFENQCHFWNQHKILVGKMVLFFLFMKLPILPYFQLLIASIKLQPTNFAIPQVNTPFWSPDTMYFLLKRLKVVDLVTYDYKRVSQKTCHTLQSNFKIDTYWDTYTKKLNFTENPPQISKTA